VRALVVIPTFNEAESITEALDRALAADPRVDVLVVDDGSPDGTAKLVLDRAEDEPRVHLMERSGKQGLGAAYRAGFGWGLERGYDALVEMDADLSHPPERLPALLDGLAGDLLQERLGSSVDGDAESSGRGSASVASGTVVGLVRYSTMLLPISGSSTPATVTFQAALNHSFRSLAPTALFFW
jgi:glycosyltransferase involved in cell wall biosynthesis